MPKQSSNGIYKGTPRISSGDSVIAHGFGLGEGQYNKLTKCMTITLAGASDLVAASAIALGGLSLLL
jgi:hypothetical protein